jgi:hypothetical protein
LKIALENWSDFNRKAGAVKSTNHHQEHVMFCVFAERIIEKGSFRDHLVS